MATFRIINGRHQVQIRRKGKSTSATFATETEAKQWAWSQESDKPAPRHNGPELATFADVIDEYLRVVSPTHRSGYNEKNLLGSIRRHWIATVLLSQLRAHHFASYRDDRLVKVKANTVVRTLNLVKPMLDKARVEWGCPIVGNPAKEIKIKRSDDSRTGRIDQDKLALYLEFVKKTRNKEVPRMILLALETTMRRSELLAMDWKDVDLHAGIISVPISKNGEYREVAMTPRAQALIEQATWRSGKVLRCTQGSVRAASDRAKKKAGLPADFCFHKLRHEGISRLWELGLNEVEISSMSGHKDWRMIRRYSHVQSTTLADKLKRIEACKESEPPR